MEAGEVAETYRDSLFVPSPPGNSPDCFRTYEAVIAGAVPLLDGRPTDYAWSGRFYAPGEGPGNGGGGEERQAWQRRLGGGAAPFPAPLGMVFLAEYEDPVTRRVLDLAGFEQDRYSLVRRGFGAQGSPSWEAPWRSLLAKAKAMGSEEWALRRQLNARYFVSAITEARSMVQSALLEAAS